MGIINDIKARVVRWFANELARESSVWSRSCNCILGVGAVLYPEASIGNNAGGPDRIRIGSNSHVRGRLQTYGHGGQICIGDWCYIGVRSEIWSMESITIGNRVLIAHDVNIHDGTAHSLDPKQRHDHFRHIVEKGHPTLKEELPGVFSAPIVIDDDVWISFGVTILRGVHIGTKSVIASNSIVAGDVPSGAFYRCQVSPIISPLRSY